jgi:hypothetical protein
MRKWRRSPRALARFHLHSAAHAAHVKQTRSRSGRERERHWRNTVARHEGESNDTASDSQPHAVPWMDPHTPPPQLSTNKRDHHKSKACDVNSNNPTTHTNRADKFKLGGATPNTQQMQAMGSKTDKSVLPTPRTCMQTRCLRWSKTELLSAFLRVIFPILSDFSSD